nr:MAG: replication associated protein [Cressdnaviricota sp.]
MTEENTQKRARAWCWTLNNYTDDDIASIKSIECSYLVFGKEVGKEGTHHLQGYIEFKDAKSLLRMKKYIPKAHFEIRLGTPEDASKYCKKEDQDYYEFGIIKHQGLDSDLRVACERVKAKAPLDSVAIDLPETFVRFHSGLEKLAYIVQEDRTVPPIVTWVWGLAGTGKTRLATEGHEFYIKDGTQWWNGYHHQERIVIDDFDGHWPFRDLLRLLDRYPYQGQTKGGYVRINSPEIWITCEFSPETFWGENELAQVQRRISNVIHLHTSFTQKRGGNTDPTPVSSGDDVEKTKYQDNIK